MTTTQSRSTSHLTTWRTAEEVEAIDTSVIPLPWRIDPIEAEQDRYMVGDPVIVESKDGAIFIGHVEDVDFDALIIYIELD